MDSRNLIKIFVLISFLVNILYSDDKKLIIYDPLHHHGINFYSTVKSIFPDSVRVIFNLDSTINNSDALFIFLSDDTNEYIMEATEGDLLITYMTSGSHVYIYSEIDSQNITNVSFWNYIGIQYWAGWPIITHVDSIVGVAGTFTEGIVIPHEFDYGYMSGIGPGCYKILEGIGPSLPLIITYAFEADSAYAVIDLFNEIFNQTFLERVLLYFNLIESSSVWNEPSVQIDDFILHQNYPNPFNSVTTISFQLYKEETVKLQLYNSLGQEIMILINNQKLRRGIHYYNFNFSLLSSGLFYYKLKSGSTRQIRKMLLSK